MKTPNDFTACLIQEISRHGAPFSLHYQAFRRTSWVDQRRISGEQAFSDTLFICIVPHPSFCVCSLMPRWHLSAFGSRTAPHSMRTNARTMRGNFRKGAGGCGTMREMRGKFFNMLKILARQNNSWTMRKLCATWSGQCVPLRGVDWVGTPPPGE